MVQSGGRLEGHIGRRTEPDEFDYALWRRKLVRRLSAHAELGSASAIGDRGDALAAIGQWNFEVGREFGWNQFRRQRSICSAFVAFTSTDSMTARARTVADVEFARCEMTSAAMSGPSNDRSIARPEFR